MKARVVNDVVIALHPDGALGDAAIVLVDVPDSVQVGAHLVGGAWVNPAPVAVALAPTIPKVGPIAFKLLFTSAERVAAKVARATDPILDDFWGLLDDPRTLEVDMGLPSVQMAIEYTLMVAKSAGVALDVAARKAEILTGVVG